MQNKQYIKLTVYDIAKLAGVSQSTVSKVLNNYPNIKDSTKDRVLKAIEDLNFKPDPVARSLVTKKSNTIGLIVSDITNPFYSQSAKVILEHAKLSGYNVIIYNSDNEDIDTSIYNLTERRVDGILIASINRKATMPKELLEGEYPILLYNQILDKKHNYFVNIDDKFGVQIAMNYLMSLGHSRIAFISGPNNRSTYYNRYLGYKSSLKQYGIIYDKNIVHVGETDIGLIESLVMEMLSKPDRPTCFFAGSDAIALEIIAVLTNNNIKIPEDISVIGFGDIKISSHPNIDLTTVSQNVDELSKIALEKIISIIEDNENNKSIKITLEPKLIIRGSVKEKL